MIATYVIFHVQCDLCDEELTGHQEIGPAILEAIRLEWHVGLEGHDGLVNGNINALCPACFAEQESEDEDVEDPDNEGA